MIAAGRQQTRFKIGDAFSHPTNENDCKNLDSVVTFVCHDKLSSYITGFIDFRHVASGGAKPPPHFFSPQQIFKINI